MNGLSYVRISLDPSGQKIGVIDHQRRVDEYAAENDINLIARYADDNVGASRFSAGNRPEFDRMMAWLQSGEYSGDLTILSTEVSRLFREMKIAQPLLDLARSRRAVLIVREVDGAVYDLASESGARDFQIAVAAAEFETAKLSKRLAGAHQRKLHHKDGAMAIGNRPFGYNKVERDSGDPRRPIRTLEPHPVEAEYVREAANRLIAGETVYGILKSWDERGIRTTTGGRWSNSQLPRLLLHPRNVGLRTYQPRHSNDPRKGVTHQFEYDSRPGNWPAILDIQTWHDVKALLRAPERRPQPVAGRVNLLAGMVRCSLHPDTKMLVKGSHICRECKSTEDGPLQTDSLGRQYHPCGNCGARKRPMRYACPECGLAISTLDLERVVTNLILDVWMVGDGEYDRAVEQRRLTAPDTSGLEQERRDLKARLGRKLLDYQNDLIDAATWNAVKSNLDQQIGRVDTEIARLEESQWALRRKVTELRGQALRDDWKTSTLDKRRALVGSLIKWIEVSPAVKGGRYFDEGRIAIEPWFKS